MIDVAIVGAGPNGLMLACELALSGMSPVVLERLRGPSTEQRANGMVGQVVRMLDRRGLYERLTGDSVPPTPLPGFVFAAFPLDLREITDNPLYALMVPQRDVEEMLERRAVELGVAVRRGCEVVGIAQDGDKVTVSLAGGNSLTAQYVVAADGGKSTVRKLVGIDFPGVTEDRSVSRTAHVSVPAELVDPVTGGLTVAGYGIVPPYLHTRTESGLIVWAQQPGKPPMISTIEWPESIDDQPMTPADAFDDLRASVARVLQADLAIGPPEGDGPHVLRRLSGQNTRIADRYRAGRVLLLGDAAHVHSAIGGPGLNLGLQDAVNLGWKLAARVHGWGPDTLLDTYQAERRPVAERVTMSTQAQAALIAPGSEVTALRALVSELLAEPRVRAEIAALMSGADVGYDMAVSADPPTGRWAPDLFVHDSAGSRHLARLTRPGRPLLIDSTATLALAAAPWNDRVDILTVEHIEGTAARSLLLRPDCYVAWASESRRPNEAQLRTALKTWFGRRDDVVR